ncbi:uncharacterized protein PFL1_02623 [Pseudozyma flocculosa PF-1]|uniref:Meiotically up-regulated protein Msb1/Mug8 domain-containing protein n=2 Tax=Pseudozyma flocculosa TaxID=84751 RepID=A0A5C3EYD7_9BASI|nr:uncharacterized protein PFL1_02623 [Pseudozyma flocculosa PF-1]EPQ29951.1 hypothetical protein PFL1_02623 [Pseudozyma flocculosa PF-1]SPO37264.1 uncharacterized protein PSFLO_02736 [Pseudozyma flocculosa]
MPALFSKRTAKGKGSAGLSKGGFGSTSTGDLKRIDLLTPSPSLADAHPLPAVPTKDDLPPLPLSANDAYLNVSQGSSGPQSAGSQHSEFGRLDNPTLRAKASSPSLPTARKGGAGTPNHLTIHGSAFGSLRRSKSKTAESLRPLSPPMTSSAAFSIRSFSESAKKTLETPSYGYTPQSTDVQLDPSRVLPILEACGDQIRKRGLDSPLIFSSMALDLNPDSATSLIKAFQNGSAPASRQTLPAAFLEEVQYANPHDLAAVIKWAFARMGRVLAVPIPSTVPAKKGEVREEMVYIQQRGFLDMDLYMAWRESERRSRHPPDAFNSFLQQLQTPTAQLLSSLFSLLSSTASYSLKNGMVPAKLAKHFGPLLFGLPEDETFARTYDAFVRASNAAEHLLLAYIRSQAAVSAQPPKLMDHVAGYPTMLATDIAMPGKHAKMVPVVQIERQVRLYSPDLVHTACEIDLDVECPEWDACRHDSDRHGKDPQLSDRFRKLINLRGGGAQGRGKVPSGVVAFGQTAAEDAEVKVYGSLVSKQWGDFLADGFTAPDETKLAFDLNESARKGRHQKRDTVQWTEFQSLGFDSADDGLDTVLSFDDGLKQEVENWPDERERILSRLRERQKALPPFHYDTTPRLIASPSRAGDAAGTCDGHPISRMDEAFGDVWADYLVGAGWSNRDELTHRTSNFAVLQYKSRPGPSTVGSQSAGSSLSAPTRFVVPRRDELGQDIPEDPRTDAAWFVIQEVVPQLYRAELEVAGRGKSRGNAMVRKFTMFRSKKDRYQDDYLTGAESDPFRPGYGGETKHIRLSDIGSRTELIDGASGPNRYDAYADPRPSRLAQSQSHSRLHVSDDATLAQQGRPSADSNHAQFRSEGSNGTGQRLMSTLRAKSMRVVKGAKKSSSHLDGAPPQQHGISSAFHQTGGRAQNGGHDADASFTSEDFEVRSVHDSDDPDAAELEGRGGAQRKRKNLGGLLGAQEKQDTKDDAWLDVLFKANENRMTGQDVAWRAPRKSNGLRVAGAANVATTANGLTETAVPDATSASMTKTLALDTDAVSRDEPQSFDTPRASTPPQFPPLQSSGSRPDAATAEHEPELDRIDSPSSSRAELDSRYLDRSSSTIDANAKTETADTSLVLPAPPIEVSSGRSSPLQPSPSIAEHSPLRSTLRPVASKEAQPKATIDTRALVESLRAGLSPVEAVRKSKAMAPASPASETSASRIDPFSKDRTAGRVATVASRFGGKGAPKSPLEPLSPTRVGPIAPPPKSPKRALAAAALIAEPDVSSSSTATTTTTTTTTTPVDAPMTAEASVDSPDVTLSPIRRRHVSSGAEPLSPTKTIDSYVDQDSIYPEDAASNYHFSGEPADAVGGDEEEEEVTSDPPREWRLVPRSGDNGQGFAEDYGRAEEEDEVYAMPTGYREPYQPGMPLDNVMEESESVLSGSNNL